MQTIPIPPLEQTLERFIEGIFPLLNQQQIEQTQQVAEAFKLQAGPMLQQRLIDYAEQQTEKGKSWLTDLKLNEYLQDSRSHSITNNASLQLDYPYAKDSSNENRSTDQSIVHAASLIHRLLRLHIDYINNDIEQPVDGRNQPISMYNWRMLTGAMRIANSKQAGEYDYYYYAPKQAANRSISVFWQGHHFSLQVTDDNGHIYAITKIEKALNAIINGSYELPELGFAEMSALDSSKTQQYLEALCQQPHNQQVYDTLKDSLFCFSLYHSGAEDEQQIKQQTFIPGNAWQYKPNTYQMDLDSDFLAIHFEHSELDGAAILQMFNYALQVELDSTELAQGEIAIEQLDWKYDADFVQRIKQDVADIYKQAAQLNVRICTADYTDITNKVSHDALMQFAMLYAQLKVFGEVRNTYEAVDTSHFMAGRTEALRPNSAEAIALAKSLLKNQATFEQLERALAAHKQRVIACKKGQAFDRHLSGLKFMIDQKGDDLNNDPFIDSIEAFYNSPGYKTLTGGDFLSTSSMGSQTPVKRILFAPVMQGGFGVNYSLNAKDYEIVYFGDQQSSQYLDDMCQASVEAIKKLVKMVG